MPRRWSSSWPGLLANPEMKTCCCPLQSDTEAYYGRMSKARDFSRRAVDSAVRADSKETAASWQVNAALREAELGNAAFARQGVAAALAAVSGAGCESLAAALALARIGDVPRAQALAEEVEKSYPTNTLLKLYWLPTINAAIEVSKRQFIAGDCGFGIGRALRTGRGRNVHQLPVPRVRARAGVPVGAQRRRGSRRVPEVAGSQGHRD